MQTTSKTKKLSYEEVVALRMRRGKIVIWGALTSVFGGVALAVGAKGMKDSSIAPTPAFYAYKRRLLSGKLPEPGENLQDPSLFQDMSYTQMLIYDQGVNWPPFFACGAVGAATAYLFFRGFFAKRLITCPANKYLIIYKSHRGHNYDNGIFNTMLEEGQTQFVYPIFQDFGYLTRENIPVNLKNVTFHTSDKIPLQLSIEMNVGVTRVATEVCYASAKHLNKTVPQMSQQATEVLENAFRDNILDFSSEEIDRHADDFFIYLQQLTGWYMRYLGYAVRDCSLLSVKMGALKMVRKDLMKSEETEE